MRSRYTLAGATVNAGSPVGQLVVEDAGRVHLFSGATGARIRTLISPQPMSDPDFAGGPFGRGVAGVPDVDGDGVEDLLVLAREPDGTFYMRVYVFSGATGALLTAVNTTLPFYAANGPISGVPDTDGDGAGDVLFGVPSADPRVFGGGLDQAGEVYLYSGSTGALLRRIVSPTPEQDANFGFSVTGVSDVNGDGRGDLLVGARHGGYGDTVTPGRAYLLSGSGEGRAPGQRGDQTDAARRHLLCRVPQGDRNRAP